MFFDSPKPPRWAEDRQWARSRLTKSWNSDKQLVWTLETRTEDLGGGTIRMGELAIRGDINGTLTLSILDSE